MFVDVHAHLNDPKFAGEEERVADLCLQAGVGLVVNAGYDLSSSEKAKELAERFPFMYFTAGVHPDHAGELDGESEKRLIGLLSHPKCVGVGEIGFDFHWNVYPRDVQERAFLRQAEIACREELPFVVHSREASAATTDFLKKHADLTAHGFVLHCYSESVECAKVYRKLGAYFTFGGVITFTNAKKEEVVSSIPPAYVTTETDCPYLAPHPLRGTKNTPANIPIIVEKLASIYGMTVKETEKIAEENARKIFKRL